MRWLAGVLPRQPAPFTPSCGVLSATLTQRPTGPPAYDHAQRGVQNVYEQWLQTERAGVSGSWSPGDRPPRSERAGDYGGWPGQTEFC